ncbi:hypothetical protein ACQ4PT_037566 [Festuca glaucescens]
MVHAVVGRARGRRLAVAPGDHVAPRLLSLQTPNPQLTFPLSPDLRFTVERSRKMVLVESIGKYRVGRTIGEGSFAKVKLAVDTETGGSVAVKVIDRSTVLRNNLMYQVKREISAMKLLNHPNIVKIHEVIATKTKICLVMEYVPGGQLSDRIVR